MKEGSNIPVRNVFYMLAYAFGSLRQGEYRNLATEDFEHVHDLLAAVLALGLGRQLKQGLKREYMEVREETVSLRGKLDVAGTVAARLSRRRSVVCSYDELSEDNAANRAIKAAGMLLVRHGTVDERRRLALLRDLACLQSVGHVDLRQVRWDSFRWSRMSLGYRTLLSVCQMIAEGMLLTNEAGELRIAEFIDDQHLYRLFEKFVLNYYREEHRWLNAGAPHIPWAIDDGPKELLPTMRSDITLSLGNRVLIIDTKFYEHTLHVYHGARSVISGNLYQIFTYVKNREALFADAPHEVSGMLLYARTNEEVQPDQSYLMSGNRIEVRTLDLSSEFEDIASALDAIAYRFFGNGKSGFHGP